MAQYQEKVVKPATKSENLKADQNVSPPQKEASKASFQPFYPTQKVTLPQELHLMRPKSSFQPLEDPSQKVTPLPQELHLMKQGLHRNEKKVMVDSNTYLRGGASENETTSMKNFDGAKQVSQTKHIFGNENMDSIEETSPDRPRQKRDLPAIYQREQVRFLCLITNHQYFRQYHRHHHHHNDHQ